MTVPQRIQLRRTKGYRKPPDAIVVARPTMLGNPYVVGDEATLTMHDGMTVEVVLTPALAVAAFAELMRMRLLTWDGMHDEDRAYSEQWRARVDALRGHDLACWCPLDQPCHADVLLRLANEGRGTR